MLRTLGLAFGGNQLPSQRSSSWSKCFQPQVRALSSSATTPAGKQNSSFLGPIADRVRSGSKLSRWSMVLPAFAAHLCIGSPYAWSVLTDSISREQGFVASAANDWTFGQATLPMSIMLVITGVTAASAGHWQLKVGTRASMAVGALAFGGGMMLTGLAVHIHSLPLVYFAYGVLGGLGAGLTYAPPVQVLIDWFPDRRGLASSMCIAGFGSGALLFTPLVTSLRKHFARLPDYIGPMDAVDTVTQDGCLFAQVGDGTLREVVLANSADLSKIGYDLAEGYYAVSTGSTGTAAALGVMGAGYLATMMLSALTIKRPRPGFIPEGWTPPPPAEGTKALIGNVPLDNVMKTPQFYQLMTTMFCIASGGYALISVAKPMMSQVFTGALPALVTASFAGSYVMAMAVGNLSGRVGWGVFSDAFGRKLTWQIFTLGSIPLYLSVPYCVDALINGGTVWPLYVFMGTTIAAIGSMGGAYATLPAYESDLFGSKYVGPIHGRFLMAAAFAGFTGPSVLLALKSRSEAGAIRDLLNHVDPAAFKDRFGASVSQAAELIQTKTVTISSLMEIMPAGVQDPSPFMYNTTMYAMAGFMATAAVTHSMLKPVHQKFFEVESEKVEEVE